MLQYGDIEQMKADEKILSIFDESDRELLESLEIKLAKKSSDEEDFEDEESDEEFDDDLEDEESDDDFSDLDEEEFSDEEEDFSFDEDEDDVDDEDF